MYHCAPINHSIPSRLEVGVRSAQITMQVSPDYWHSGQAMHGSMYFKGLDDAAFFAANSIVDDLLVLTAKFQVELVGMVRSQTVFAQGQVEKREGRKIWATAELFDEGSSLVARGSGLFIVSKILLSETTGYLIP